MLYDQLSLKNQIKIKKELKKCAGIRLKKIMDKIGKRNKHFTEKEIMDDIEKAVKEVRSNSIISKKGNYL